jgi:hypothetical protein
MRWKMPVECCLPDTLFLKRFLSDGDSMHHKHRSSGTGELMVLTITGNSGVRRYLQQG